MILGYNTNGFASHPLDAALRLIAELGYRSVGITLDHMHLNPYAGGHDADVAEAAALCRQLGLVPVVETGARYLLDPWRKHRPTLLDDTAAGRAHRMDFLERAVRVAERLGAGVVSLWSGEGAGESEALDARLCDGLRALCARAADAGVVLALEPEPGHWVEDLAGWERVRARVDHPALRMTLDVGHAHLTEPEGAAAAVRRAAGWIANVHLEGMRRPVHEHLFPGEGDLDLAACVWALRDVGYAGPATLELSRHSHAAVDVARRAREFCRTLGWP
jgi:sugar phosphate isomerase/epimerase